MVRRLFIAFLLIAGVSLLCWLVLPRVGFDVPWWLPLLGYVIILGGAVAPEIEAALERRRSRAEGERDAFLDDDPGPSQADIERFGRDDGPDLRLRR